MSSPANAVVFCVKGDDVWAAFGATDAVNITPLEAVHRASEKTYLDVLLPHASDSPVKANTAWYNIVDIEDPTIRAVVVALREAKSFGNWNDRPWIIVQDPNDDVPERVLDAKISALPPPPPKPVDYSDYEDVLKITELPGVFWKGTSKKDAGVMYTVVSTSTPDLNYFSI